MDKAGDGGGAIDRRYLHDVAFGDAALARELLVLFDGQCAALGHVSVAGTDRRSRLDALHALRGAASAVGAREVATEAGRLERAIEDDEGEGVPSGARLWAAIDAARADVAAIVNDGLLAKPGEAA